MCLKNGCVLWSPNVTLRTVDPCSSRAFCSEFVVMCSLQPWEVDGTKNYVGCIIILESVLSLIINLHR